MKRARARTVTRVSKKGPPKRKPPSPQRSAPEAKRKPAEPPRRIGANCHVTLECTLRDEEGEVIELRGGGGRVEYVHGYGMLVPGLETAVAGLARGDHREIYVPPASGYGERDEDLVLEIDRSEFPSPGSVAAGDEVEAEWPDGESQAMRVVEVKDDSVVVDANHPLAGMALRYFVKVLDVRQASVAEIEKAAREQDEAEERALAEHEHGPGCEHEAHEAPGELITLGTRKRAPS